MDDQMTVNLNMRKMIFWIIFKFYDKIRANATLWRPILTAKQV